MVWTQAKRSAAAKKAARTRKRNLLKKSGKNSTRKKRKTRDTTHQKLSSKKINDSEGKFLELLEKKLNSEAIVFKTGAVDKKHYKKFAGVPDIAAFEKNKITFYEIKPAIPKQNKGLKSEFKNLDASFLKEHQEDWIKKNCLKKGANALKPKVFLVFYKKGRKNVYRYFLKKLSRTSLARYSRSADKKKRDKTLKFIVNQRYSQKI